jgi:phosphoribosylformylglycinamidine synthase
VTTGDVFLARVRVTLKTSVNDPVGQTIHHGLRDLGFDSITGVRSGKYFEVRLEAESEASARAAVDSMCDKLLANPVIESYEVEIVAAG